MSELLPVGVACQICPLLAYERAGFWDEDRREMRYNLHRQLTETVSPHQFAITMKANLPARRAPDGPRPIVMEER